MTEPKTIAGTLAADDRFSLMAGACRATGLDVVLAGKGPLTVCAPTNQAFLKLSPREFSVLVQDICGVLPRVLQYHILSGRLPAAALGERVSCPTLLDIPASLSKKDGRVFVCNAPVLLPDICCSNGMLHGIGTVLLPL
ncbi:MAG: fasciclin domain-containing protein [Methanoregula sp.]|jgi:uncharacterized surface protein with fasciclin (FAS1) repeats